MIPYMWKIFRNIKRAGLYLHSHLLTFGQRSKRTFKVCRQIACYGAAADFTTLPLRSQILLLIMLIVWWESIMVIITSNEWVRRGSNVYPARECVCTDVRVVVESRLPWSHQSVASCDVVAKVKFDHYIPFSLYCSNRMSDLYLISYAVMQYGPCSTKFT
jgi:hypothetical protein